MANKKLNQLVTKPSIASGDLFPIADATTGQLYKTTISDLGTAIGSGVSSVNGLVGAVVLDTDDIQELASPVNKWFTDLRARAALSAGTGISYSSSTGVIASTITQYTDAMARAAHSLTTTGSNGSATYNYTTGVLNVPTYTLSGLGGQPLATNLTALAGLSYSNLGFLKMTGVGTFALDTNTYALDSAVVHNTGNETVAGQKTFSSTIYGAGAVFSAALVAQSISITGITASPSVYITTNGTNHAVSIVQSGSGYAIYASGNVAVIGTGYFSSSLTAASLSSTAGYNYTLPSASGTLALTSNLSSYLPLSGGTLTGNLSLPSNNTIGGTNYYIGQQMASNDYWQIYGNSVAFNQGEMVFQLGDDGTGLANNGQRFRFYIDNAAGGTAKSPLIIDYDTSTFTTSLVGTSASFSSTLSATGNLTVGNAVAATNVKLFLNGVASKAAGIEFQQSGTSQWYLGNGIASEDNNFELYNSNGTMAMKIIKSNNNINFIGATTFANTITIESSGSSFRSGGELRFYRSDNGIYTSLNDAGSGAGNGFILNNTNSEGFHFKNATSTIMRLSSAGYVGIATTSPASLLDISSTNPTLTLTRNDNSTTASAAINFSATSNVRWQIGTNQAIGNGLEFNTANGSGNKMYLTNSGTLCIGTSSPATGSKLTVTGGDINLTNGIVYANGASAGLSTQNREGSNLYIWIGFNAGLKLYNDALGFIGTFSASTGIYTPTSDINKKKDFELSNIGLNEVLQLKPTFYRMKSDNSQGMKELGFLAQEVKEVIPNAYVENEGFIGLNFNPIVAALTKAVQEQQVQIQELKQQLANK